MLAELAFLSTWPAFSANISMRPNKI